MFVFTITEENGYVFSTSTLNRLEKYLLNTYPRKFNLKIQISKKCQYVSNIKLTKQFISNYFEGQEGQIDFSKYYDDNGKYAYVVIQLINEILISCMLSNSPTLLINYDAGNISIEISKQNVDWNFNITATNPDLSKEIPTIIKSKNISNPLMYHPEIFNAYAMFNMVLGRPIVIMPLISVYSGYPNGKEDSDNNCISEVSEEKEQKEEG